MKKILSLTAALLLAGAGAASATQLVRELWDNCQPGGGSVPLVQVSTGTSSVGFTPAGSWYVSPVGQNAICFANNFDITDWELTSYGGNPNPLEAGAPAPYFGQGALYDNVGNLATFDTTNANDIWLSTSWAARPLTSGIDFASGNTYYFTVRMAKNYSYDTGGLETDNATMIGFSDGNSSTSDFFSVGFTREAVVDGGAIGYWSLDGTTDYGDSLFISYGTLGQPGYPNHNGANNSFDSGGPYYVQAVGPLQELDFPSDPFGTFVVGQIVTTLGGGPATISAKVELPGSSLYVTVPGSWDVSAIYTPANTNQVLNNLLLGMYGAFPGEIDAIRASTNYDEVINIEAYPTYVAGPQPYYVGTTLQLEAIAQTCENTSDIIPDESWYGNGNNNYGTITYQWRWNGTPFVADTGDFTGTQTQTLTINNPQTTDSGIFDCIVSSTGGDATTIGPIITPATNIVINVAVPPYVTTQPIGGARWIGGASYTMSVVANGAGPLTYQWYQNGVSLGAGATGTSLTVNPSTTNAAGSYTVVVSGHSAPPATSLPAIINVLVPVHDSFDEAVLANTPYAYWQLNEPNGSTVVNDLYGGNNGVYLNADNVNLASAGPGTSNPGFDPAQTGVNDPSDGELGINGPEIPTYGGEMTMLIWVNYSGYGGQGGDLMSSRNNNDGCGGYCGAYRLYFYDNNNQLGYQYEGNQVPSGLYAVPNQWNFVALVYDAANSQVIMYVGTNGPLTAGGTQLQSAVLSGPSGPADAGSNPLSFGRNPYGWEGTWNYNGVVGTMSDAAVFYSALSPATIQALYLAGAGEAITYTQNPDGSVTLNWVEGTLQRAATANGPWSNVTTTSPSYTTSAGGIYRVAR